MKKNIGDILEGICESDYATVDTGDEETRHLIGANLEAHIKDLEKRMTDAAGELEFEEAARLRDEIHRLQESDLGLATKRSASASNLRRPGRSHGGAPGTRATGKKGKFSRKPKRRSYR